MNFFKIPNIFEEKSGENLSKDNIPESLEEIVGKIKEAHSFVSGRGLFSPDSYKKRSDKKGRIRYTFGGNLRTKNLDETKLKYLVITSSFDEKGRLVKIKERYQKHPATKKSWTDMFTVLERKIVTKYEYDNIDEILEKKAIKKIAEDIKHVSSIKVEETRRNYNGLLFRKFRSNVSKYEYLVLNYNEYVGSRLFPEIKHAIFEIEEGRLKENKEPGHIYI
ncbi:hypothetical protein GF361_03715 [Candidatus Woesearchaeota archaeon]|nr:hypothetical protein [Candidatus Woesearchaeota archaeon]